MFRWHEHSGHCPLFFLWIWISLHSSRPGLNYNQLSSWFLCQSDRSGLSLLPPTLELGGEVERKIKRKTDLRSSFDLCLAQAVRRDLTVVWRSYIKMYSTVLHNTCTVSTWRHWNACTALWCYRLVTYHGNKLVYPRWHFTVSLSRCDIQGLELTARGLHCPAASSWLLLQWLSHLLS